MATAGVQGAAAAGVFVGVPVVGWAVGIAAAFVDYYYILPALSNKPGKGNAPEQLLDVPVGSNDVGAPRVWAIGTRVRVPTHILWQDSKTREETSGSNNKGGTQTTLRRVIFDAALALNDRPTQRLVTLYGNGRLMLFRSRNQLQVRTHLMTLAQTSGTTVVLTMADTLQPAFTEKFKLGDYVQLRDWVQTAGTAAVLRPFKVTAIADHSSTTPSTVTLTRQFGAATALVGVAAYAGTSFQPGIVERIDDRVYSTAYGVPGPSSQFHYIDSHLSAQYIFIAFEPIIGTTQTYGSTSQGQYRRTVFGTFSPSPPLGLPPLTGYWMEAQPALFQQLPQAFDPLVFSAANPTNFYFGVFAASWNPDSFYYSGSDTQTADPILSNALGAANVPAYRGLSYQVLDGFVATLFGDQLPYSCEAVLEVDNQMDWPQAIDAILRERGNLLSPAIDTSGVTPKPFQGYFLRGAVPVVQAIQPLLIAGQIMVQDRDGVLSFTEFANADVVSVNNGATFTDFGTRLDTESAADDKWTVEDKAEEDLPTRVSVRHQDADNVMLAGYQSFGIRAPESTDNQNEQDVDLRQLVLTRREASNLAATMLRRAWVNRRTYRFTLPASYLHLLESDLLTWTDDDGQDHTARIIQRDVGSDFRVNITCLAEDVDLAVTGSAAQSGADFVPPVPGGASGLEVVVIDAPAVRESQNDRPGLHIAIDQTGGPWAGAAIYESVDGTNYRLLGTTDERSVVGTSETAFTIASRSEIVVAEYEGSPFLPAFGVFVDPVTFQFSEHSAARVNSVTNYQAQTGTNWCALIAPGRPAEIAAFVSVTALGDGRFTLDNWYRGLRGTAPDTWPAGTKLVLLDDSPYWHEFEGEITPTSLTYKVVPAGLTLDDVEGVSIVNGRRNALPLPVRWATTTIHPTTLSARLLVRANWCRAVLPVFAQPPHPMDEPFESYRFTIYDPTGRFVRRVRTITASQTGSNTLRDRWIDYTAAEQSADGYTPGPSTFIIFTVQQVGQYGIGP